MTPRHRLLICEDHTILRAGLRALLGKETDIEVVGETGDVHGALALMTRFRPDLVIVDCMMQGTNGTDVIAQLAACRPETRILVLTQQKTAVCIHDALRAGANGYVLKNATDAELIWAVRSVLNGRTYLSPAISEHVVNALLSGSGACSGQTNLESLTRRERQVLRMVAEGCTNRYIAEELSLSVKTVEKHRSNLMRKLDLHNVSALTTFAIGQGLVNTG